MFSLVPPFMANSLAGKLQTPEAASILRAADRVLAETPHALRRIHLEGTLPHQGIYDQSKEAVADLTTVRELALAYRLTSDAKYLAAVEPFLLAWAKVYQVNLNPIDETNFTDFLVGYDLVQADVQPATRTAMTGFLRQFAEGYAKAVVDKRKDARNWQSHRIKIFTQAAFALGDAALIAQAHAAFTEHLHANIHSDGSVDDFYERDAMHYVLYDLEPLTVACLAAKEHGQDWFHEGDPHSVAHGIDWLTPFVTGQQTHIEFVHSKVKFDQTRAQAGIAEYAPHPWEPSASIQLLTLGGAMEPGRQDLCQQVAANAHRQPTDWIKLLFW